MERHKIRIALIKGYVIKKHCRKEQFELVQGIGDTTEQAIENFKSNFSNEKQNWKESRFSQPIVFDAERIIYDSYSSIKQPLMPNAKDNIETFTFVT